MEIFAYRELAAAYLIVAEHPPPTSAGAGRGLEKPSYGEGTVCALAATSLLAETLSGRRRYGERSGVQASRDAHPEAGR